MSDAQKNIDYWIACSGGVDSVVLVRLFKEMNKDFGILHCNFNLRGDESEKDEYFVRELARSVSVPIHMKQFNTKKYIDLNGGNTQLAARDLRYTWFEEIKRKTNAKIVLGHHKDDQVETFLLQLRRGGKLRGLSCMPIFYKGYVRPLLKYKKDEIYNLARKNNWSWREDLSNKESSYLRNYYRNELIPFALDGTDSVGKINKLIKDFQILLSFVQRYLNEQFDFSGELKINFSLWDSWPIWIKHAFISKSDLMPLSVKEIERLRLTSKGKYLKNEKKSIWNEGNYFVIREKSYFSTVEDYVIELISSEKVKLEKGVIFIDKEKVLGNPSIRKWEDGERFQPFGMKNKKTISKYLRDRKILSSDKRSYLVVVDSSDQILGVVEMCPDERYKIKKSTKWVYSIKKLLTSSR